MLNKKLREIILVLGVILLYRDSFFSRFFQDDKLQLAMARSGNWLATVPNNNHYHPISIQLFYSLGDLITPNQPFGFHLILFIAFLLTLKLFYNFAFDFLKDKAKAFMAVFFYSFNLSLFANFYWVANSHFVLAPFFALLTIHCYRQKSILFNFITPLVFLLGLGSNELFYIYPAGLFLYAFFTKNINRGRLATVALFDLIAVFLRITLLHLPTQNAYRFVFDFRLIKTIWWYVLRVLNLPEGIRNQNNALLYFLFAVLVGLILVSAIRLYMKHKLKFSILIFGALWFFIFGLTFFLLPNHMSAHYMSTSLFGVSIILAELIHGRKTVFITILVYILMSYFGLEFLKATHWIILKNTGPVGSF